MFVEPNVFGAVSRIDISPDPPQDQLDTLIAVSTWLNKRITEDILFTDIPTGRKIIMGWSYPRIIDETTHSIVIVRLWDVAIHSRLLDASFSVRLAQGDYRVCFKSIAERLGHIERFTTTLRVGVLGDHDNNDSHP